jgi:hypothetical protein
VVATVGLGLGFDEHQINIAISSATTSLECNHGASVKRNGDRASGDEEEDEDSELRDIADQTSMLNHLDQFGDAASAVKAVDAYVSRSSGKMSPTSQAFYDQREQAKHDIGLSEVKGDKAAARDAIERREFWSNQYDERQMNKQGARVFVESVRDVKDDIGQNWQRYGVATAEMLPFGIGTGVEAAHHGYDIYHGNQTVGGAAGIMATEAAAGYVGGKALKFAGRFGAKVINAVKGKIPTPRGVMNAGMKAGGERALPKGLTVAQAPIDSKYLVESAELAKMRMEASKLPIGFNPTRIPNAGKTEVYIKYKKPHPNPDIKPYDGITSGRVTDVNDPIQLQKILRKRDHSHKMNQQGFKRAEIQAVSENRDAIRGLEQIEIDISGGAKATGGTSSNANNSISMNNPNMRTYVDTAAKVFYGQG